MDQDRSPGIVRRHPVVTYFVLAFALAWAWVLALALPSGFPGQGEALEKVFGPAFIGMALAPVIAGLVMTLILRGRQGLRELGGAMLRWRAAPGYYALALGVVPACIIAVLSIFWALSPDFRPGLLGPDGGMLLAMGLGAGLAAGFLEEIGWTGFATRELLDKWTVLRTGIVVGVLHGAWHFVAGYWAEGIAYGWLYFPHFLLYWIGGLAALRILIVWLYQRTRSLPIAQLTHASYTGGLIMLSPSAATPLQSTLWTAVFSAVLLAVVLALVRSSPQPAARQDWQPPEAHPARR